MVMWVDLHARAFLRGLRGVPIFAGYLGDFRWNERNLHLFMRFGTRFFLCFCDLLICMQNPPRTGTYMSVVALCIDISPLAG